MFATVIGWSMFATCLLMFASSEKDKSQRVHVLKILEWKQILQATCKTARTKVKIDSIVSDYCKFKKGSSKQKVK